jgi:xanthine/uracil permease
LIVAVSLGIGLALPSATTWLAKLPFAVRAVLESGIATGGLTALGLNLLLTKPVPEPPPVLEKVDTMQPIESRNLR